MKIETLNDFMQWVSELGDDGEHEGFMYRGVTSVSHDIVEASAYRRLENKNDRTLPKLLEINRNLIKEARLRKYDQQYGRDLTDLEILGELQHFRTATCLIDFTFSSLVALWFACDPSPEKDDNNGRVGAVCNDYKIKEVSLELLSKRKSIESFFEADKHEEYPIYQWQPKGLNNRIDPQHAVFLFGGGKIELARECIIQEECKDGIREEIKKVTGISGDTLFPDFDGFTRQHAHNVSYSIPDYEKIGFQAYQRGQLDDAVLYYTKAIDLNTNGVPPYIMRAIAKGELNQYEAAIKDYNRAAELTPSNVLIYRFRGNMKALLEEYEAAIDDYNKAIAINSKDAQTYCLRGHTKQKLNDYKAAIEDYDKAIELDPNEAHFYSSRGNVKALLEEYEAAIDNYDKAITLDPNNADFYYRRAEAKYNLGDSDSARKDLEMASRLTQEIEDEVLKDEIQKMIDALINKINEDDYDDIPF